MRRNGSTVGTFDLASGQGVTLPGRQPCKGVSLAREGVNTIVIWPQAVSLVPDGAAEAIEGDEIVFHVAQRAEVAGLTRVNVRARAIPEIVFTEVRSAPVGVEEPEP